MRFLKTIFSVFVVLVLSNEIVLSQTGSITAVDNFDTLVYNKLLIIPTNPKFYLSDADRDLTLINKISYDEVSERFRNGLVSKLHYRISDLTHTIPLLTYADTGRDLPKIYASLSCKQEAVPILAKKEKKSLFSNISDKITKTIIKDGQLVNKEETGLKYMSTVILNKDLLPYLSKRYKAIMFVVINQFEIVNDLADYAAISEKQYNRQIRVHYSILNETGQKIYGGLSTCVFPAYENNIQEIITSYFKPVCEDIMSHIPPIPRQVFITQTDNAK